MKITKIDENNIKLINSEIRTAMDNIAEKYGLNTRNLNTRFTHKNFTTKLEFFIPEIFNSDELLIGNKFKNKSTIFTILKINQQTQTVDAITNRSKKYSVRFDQLANFLKIDGYPINYEQISNRYPNIDYNEFNKIQETSENIGDFERMMEDFNNEIIEDNNKGVSHDRTDQIKEKMRSNDIGSLVYTNPTPQAPPPDKKQYLLKPKRNKNQDDEEIEVI